MHALLFVVEEHEGTGLAQKYKDYRTALKNWETLRAGEMEKYGS